MSVRDIVQAAAGVGGAEGAYIEDVFSTYLYTGNGSTQTITNGIDLAGEGGLVWRKARETEAYGAHVLVDTERGRASQLATSDTSSTSASDTPYISTSTKDLVSFNSDGFTIGPDLYFNKNTNNKKYISWTFRKAPKFFDVVTYTGNSVAGRTVAHNLGSIPGFIIVKNITNNGNWRTYHRMYNGGTNPANYYIDLNGTAAELANSAYWNSTEPTDTVFTVGSHPSVNDTGATYVAYLFAHDAGGFGDDGEQNVISCGSYTGAGNGTYVTTTLGWEPQWLLIKRTNTTQNWLMLDVMRGMIVSEPYTSDNDAGLYADTSGAEALNPWGVSPTATGFRTEGNNISASGGTYVYIAIRRGPMKTPESGTEVFAPTLTSASPTTLTTIVAPDTAITRLRGSVNSDINSAFYDRLRGKDRYIVSSKTAAEATYASAGDFNSNMGFTSSLSSSPMVYYTLKRAPGFFDVICWTGDNTTNREIAHNLGVTPELIITKMRSSANAWYTYHSGITSPNANWWFNYVNINGANATAGNTTEMAEPTSTYIKNGSSTYYNASGTNYVAYLFATTPGVSKVGSYAGTGTVNQIDCGFTTGARFVLIKSYDSGEDWYVWDSARGIVSGNDPYFIMNNNAAEVTSQDRIDPYSAGFELSGANQNTVGRNYIFLAIA